MLLFEYFVCSVAECYGCEVLLLVLSELACLFGYDWLGNVCELINVVECYVLGLFSLLSVERFVG